MRTFVVEDNDGIRQVVVELLQKRGHQVSAFADAESALAEFGAQSFDLAVLDWGLPGLDGLELCRRLRARPRGDRGAIVVLTGRAEPEDLDEVVAAGANDYVTKPFKLEALETRVAFAERQVRAVADVQRVQHELEVSEDRFQRLVESLTVVTYIQRMDSDTDEILYLSPQVERLMGWTADEIKSSDGFWKTILHPDDREEIEALNRRAIEQVLPFRGEYRQLCKNGEYRWFRDESVPIRDADGKILRWHGVLLDITEQKLFELALQESEQRHRELSAAAEWQADQLRMIQSVRKAISREIVLSDTYKSVVEATREILGYPFASIYILEEGKLELQHHVGYEDASKIYYTIELDEGVISKVVASGEPKLVSNPGGEDSFLFADDAIAYEICVPLTDNGVVVGAYAIESTQDRPLDDEDLELFLGVAELVNSAITRTRLLNSAAESERRLRNVLDSVHEVVFQADEQGRWSYLNRAWEEITGYTSEESIGKPAALFRETMSHELKPERFEELRDGSLGEIRGDFRVLTANVETRWIEVHAVRASGEGGRFEITGTLTDITERKRAEAALRESQDRYRHLAMHDTLTSLPNRALFLERLESALGSDDARHRGVSVLFIDLDGFKLVNDSYGHEAGDRVLVLVAQRLRECMRPADTVARLGGDEFAILLPNVSNPEIAENVANRVLAALQPPFVVDHHELTLAASIGIVDHHGGNGRPTDLLRQADTALYAAKANGRGIFTRYEPRMSAEVLLRLRQENELRRAIDTGELQLFYQPRFHLLTGEIEGIEALVRWQHPEVGMLPPAEFIGLAEATGLIVPLGAMVLRQACQHAARWRSMTDRTIPRISVNLSAREVQEPTLVENVAATLAEFGIPASGLEFEITESAVMNDGPASQRTLRELRELGVQLAIDDFGTGYASLSSLRDLPVNAVKIDKSFVMGLGKDRASSAIVRAIATLAQALGLSVTAEGIETIDHLVRIRSMGIEFGQGYFFTRPLPVEGIETFVLGETRFSADALSSV